MWLVLPLPVSDAGGDSEPPIAPIVDRIGPPISTTPWSPDLVAQTLEILTVFRREDRLFCLTPIHAESLRGEEHAVEAGEEEDALAWARKQTPLCKAQTLLMIAHGIAVRQQGQGRP